MNTKWLVGAAIVATLSFPVASQAQFRAAPGMTTGLASTVETAAVDGGLPDKFRPFFLRHVAELRIPSYHLDGEVRVGTDLPKDAVTSYDLPSAYGVTRYRFTVVNDRAVLIDPLTNRIVQVVE
jgi:hypothetical protein